jgi:uncharacterized protein HemX
MIEFFTSPAFGTTLRILGVLSVAAAGYLSYRYFKQAGGEQAQSRLNALQKDTIDVLESRVRLLQATIEDLERILKRTKTELDQALERVKELLQERELIG